MHTKPVVVYGADWCGDCRRAESWLIDNKIPFQKIDVAQDDAARLRAIELAEGKRNIPVVVLPSGAVLVEPSPTELARELATTG